MNENNKNGVSPIVEFVDTTKNKDLQKRIVEILKEMTFKGKFRFYVGISRNFLVILVGILFGMSGCAVTLPPLDPGADKQNVNFC